MPSTTKPQIAVIQPPKTAVKPREESADKPVGRPIEPSLLKQIGGGSSTPVGRW